LDPSYAGAVEQAMAKAMIATTSGTSTPTENSHPGITDILGLSVGANETSKERGSQREMSPP
jgi:hypothetical protein